MAKKLMIQGTMSNVGKSLLTAGLLRVLHQDGYKVAPFKSQNMALNSFITEDGLEIGRAQAMQAEAAGIKPTVHMNPILLKPTSDIGSQVIVNGVSIGNMRAREYFEYKHQLVGGIKEAMAKLEEEYEIIVIEGAGSPVEMNLKKNDIVNMGVAKMFDASVLLVGDIDRGGVFAQLVGTLELLDEEEKNLVKGLIVNKFRGDVSLFESGIEFLEERTGKDVLGVMEFLPYQFEDEDSLSSRFEQKVSAEAIDVAAIRYPRISNYTDLNPWEGIEGVSLRYITSADELGMPDLIILPGSKNTMEDLRWLRESGLEAAILKQADKGTMVFGICGGYQMLGQTITDACGAEAGGSMRGMGLLPTDTEFHPEKCTTQTTGQMQDVQGELAALSGVGYEGYEIHMGNTTVREGGNVFVGERLGAYEGNIYGTYVHGIFDKKEIVNVILTALAARKGLHVKELAAMDYKQKKEMQFDALADAIRANMDMEKIYKLLEL